jgi:signal transduction histidine kinase
VREAIEGAHALVEHRMKQANVRYRVDAPDELPPVHGDKHELQQVVLNLFLNSLDALGDRGGAIAVRLSTPPGFVRIEVEDDGPGMAEQDLPRVFDPFFSKKDRPDASGLGMFISYSIVQNHGGTMRVESGAGRGFRTIVELPRPAESGAGPAQAGAGPAAASPTDSRP